MVGEEFFSGHLPPKRLRPVLRVGLLEQDSFRAGFRVSGFPDVSTVPDVPDVPGGFPDVSGVSGVSGLCVRGGEGVSR